LDTSSPRISTDATCHAARGPSQRTAAAAAAPTAATTSAKGDRAGSTGPSIGSTTAAHRCLPATTHGRHHGQHRCCAVAAIAASGHAAPAHAPNPSTAGSPRTQARQPSRHQVGRGRVHSYDEHGDASGHRQEGALSQLGQENQREGSWRSERAHPALARPSPPTRHTPPLQRRRAHARCRRQPRACSASVALNTPSRADPPKPGPSDPLTGPRKPGSIPKVRPVLKSHHSAGHLPTAAHHADRSIAASVHGSCSTARSPGAG
jgi:hypothetical protein